VDDIVFRASIRIQIRKPPIWSTFEQAGGSSFVPPQFLLLEETFYQKGAVWDFFSADRERVPVMAIPDRPDRRFQV
jgi:hypothetical protein